MAGMSPSPSGRPGDERGPGGRARFDLAIRTELARYLVRQAPTGFAVGVVAVALVTLVLWNAAPHGVRTQAGLPRSGRKIQPQASRITPTVLRRRDWY